MLDNLVFAFANFDVDSLYCQVVLLGQRQNVIYAT